MENPKLEAAKKAAAELTALAERQFKGAPEAVGLLQCVVKLATMHVTLSSHVAKLEGRIAELEKRSSVK